MKILLLSPEHVLQLSKDMGSSIAHNVEGLAEAYTRQGHEVRVIFPSYRADVDLSSWVCRGGVRASFLKVEETEAWARDYNGISVRQLRNPLFVRPHPYLDESGWDHPDNALRFAAFGAGALLDCILENWIPDVIHGHEWQSSLGILYAGTFFREALQQPKLLFTFQDAAFQGLCDASWLSAIGLGQEWLRSDKLEFWGRINLLKAGLVTADRVSVASQHYLQELLEDEHGYGLEGVFRALGDRVRPIPPGIDPERWKLPFELDGIDRLRVWKAEQRQIYAPGSRPLVTYASPFIPEAGFEQMLTIISDLLKMDIEIGFYGGENSPHREHLESISQLHPGRIHLLPGGEDSLFHLLAASDVVLLPSVHQPSGTLYAKAMALGTPCIINRMGAAADRVHPYPGEEADGFLLQGELAPDTLLRTLRKVLTVHENAGEWERLQLNCARCCYHWDVTARDFLKLADF